MLGAAAGRNSSQMIGWNHLVEMKRIEKPFLLAFPTTCGRSSRSSVSVSIEAYGTPAACAMRIGSPSRPTYGFRMADIAGFKIVGFAGKTLPS